MVLMASNQLRCVVCGDKVTLGTQRCNNKFFKCKQSQKLMYPQGYLTTCKDCLEKQVTDELGNLDKEKLI